MQILGEALNSYRAQGGVTAAAADVVLALADGAIGLADMISVGDSTGTFAKTHGKSNGGGDEPKGLDVVADQHFLEIVSRTPVAVYASEELDHPLLLDAHAPLALAMDPLDGSSNIETNLSIGTIFSILPVSGDPENSPIASFLQPGRNQIAAGFFVYGPQLALVLTFGAGTQIYVHSQSVGAFVLLHDDLSVPTATQEFAINASNYRFWDDAVRHYIDDCMSGSEGPSGRDFNMRWLASVVAEAYRILMRGGVYLYPGDSRKGYSAGRLRLVYEANPIAWVMEQAGGSATNCRQLILDLVPRSLHERVPLVFGSRNEVEQVARYHEDPELVGLRSPLFGQRGLFRS